jgi:hypothetical protein
MTRDELEGMANRVILSVQETLERGGEWPFTFMLHHPAIDRWETLHLPRGTGILMNSGEAKDAIFGFIRQVVQDKGCDAVIFASDTFEAKVTEEGKKHLDTPEWKAAVDRGFVKLARMGWVRVSESIVVTAQTSADALIIGQGYQRLGSGSIQLGKCNRGWGEQKLFKGRQKMFGDLRPENLS